MSKPKFDWWMEWKAAVRRYPSLRAGYETLPHYTYILSCEDQRIYWAIQKAVEETAQRANGTHRLKVVDLVLWKGTHTIAQAAEAIPCSLPTAQRWHHDFLRLSAQHLGLLRP